jgi:DHA2 family multidrug resistance protein
VFLINIPVGLVSLALTDRYLSDPPHVRQARDRVAPVDWVGLALIAVGLMAFELALERGQELEWFDSTFIGVCAVVAAASLSAFVVHEWRHEHPVLDVRLVVRRNFAVANALMFALAFTSFGVTVLMPQYLQALLGFGPRHAGLVLSPGGLMIFCLLPIVGKIVSKFDARLLISCGFVVVASATYYSACTMNLDMDFAAAVRLRVLQCAGFAFLFVPIQTIAYGGMPSQKSNQVAALMNLSRNLGADTGIAFLVTLIYRHRQIHQVHIVEHATPYNAPWAHAVTGEASLYARAGMSSFEASQRGLGDAYTGILKQAQQLAYLDALVGLAAMAVLGGVVVWLARRAPQPAPPQAKAR